jgi:hypothetical protein
MVKRGPGRPKSAAAADDTVGILNGEVPPDSNPTPFPKKRKRDHINDSSPSSKRRATEVPAQEVSAPRKSTRLSRPKASADQQRLGEAGHNQSRDPYEVPVTTLPQSPKTTRGTKLVGKDTSVMVKDTAGSEAKEGGEDAANPLMTSPASNTRSHTRSIGRLGQVKDGEDPFGAVEPVKRVQRPQRQLTNTTKTRSNPLLKPHPSPSSATQMSPAQRHVPEERETSAAGVSEHENGVEGDQTATNDLLPENQHITPPEESLNSVEYQSVDGAPDRTAQLSSTEEAFEKASNLYDCKESWETMLKAAEENLDEDRQGRLASEIQELVGLIRNTKLVYRSIRRGYEGNMEDKELEVEKRLGDIDEKIRAISATNNRKKDFHLIKDVYVQAIPQMVKLLRMVLVTRSMNGEISTAPLEELVEVIDATLNLCVKASQWSPRPALEYGVKKRTRNVIKTSLEALRRAYTEAQYDIADEKEEKEEEEAQRLARRQAIADHVAKFLAQEQEKKMLAEHNRRELYRARNRHSTKGNSLLANVFDVDDLGLNGASPAPGRHSMRRSLPWRETGVAAARRSLPSNISARLPSRQDPRLLRERTEDIPGPMVRKWSGDEDKWLLIGLEKFTHANRYLEIDQAYGFAGGPLSGRDVDELMQRARFYKQSMASHIEGERERVGNVDRWAFLLSVEG